MGYGWLSLCLFVHVYMCVCISPHRTHGARGRFSLCTRTGPSLTFCLFVCVCVCVCVFVVSFWFFLTLSLPWTRPTHTLSVHVFFFRGFFCLFWSLPVSMCPSRLSRVRVCVAVSVSTPRHQDGTAIGSKWGFAMSNGLMYTLKDNIDRAFMAQFDGDTERDRESGGGEESADPHSPGPAAAGGRGRRPPSTH